MVPNTHALSIAPEVRAALPAEAVARLTTDPGFERVTCVACHQPIAPYAPMSLIVLRDPVLSVICEAFAHVGCAASRLIDTDLSGLALPQAGHDLQLSASVVGTGDGRVFPTLLVEPAGAQFSGASESGDLSDLWVRAALQRGFELVLHPQELLGAPALAGWRVEVRPGAPSGALEYELEVVDPAGASVISGQIVAPNQAWEAALLAQVGLAVYIGSTLDVPGAEGHDFSVLDRLAAAGRLAGAVLRAAVTG